MIITLSFRSRKIIFTIVTGRAVITVDDEYDASSDVTTTIIIIIDVIVTAIIFLNAIFLSKKAVMASHIFLLFNICELLDFLGQ